MDWQLGFVGLVVALAAGHLIWRGFRMLRRDSSRRSCGSCNDCGGSKADSNGRRIVSLELGRSQSPGKETTIRSSLP